MGWCFGRYRRSHQKYLCSFYRLVVRELLRKYVHRYLRELQTTAATTNSFKLSKVVDNHYRSWVVPSVVLLDDSHNLGLEIISSYLDLLVVDSTGLAAFFSFCSS